MIQIKRVYDPADKSDGYRILVDRLWPRGISKEKGKIDLWLKEIAPSADLRKWFGHDPDKWSTFQARYKKELEAKRGLVEEILTKEKTEKTVTLLFAARDTEHNDAVVLMKFLAR